ncbi:MAG: ribulose-phosphate 3-epimerase [Elusimicrobia bacterium]|nr:ribulose-phosphate 3-epimerase [Elusimicrobiota bacterium]
MTAARTVEIVPSLLSADLSRLPAELRRVQEGGAEWVTVDVMDGHFVPNLSFGPDLVRAVKRLAPLRVDVHLMVTNPEAAAPWFVKAGADRVIFHLEASSDPGALARALRAQGVEAGIAVKPATPADGLLPLLSEADLALVMTVEPGFGGAAFLPAMLPKIAAVRRDLDERGLPCRLQVDGGVNLETVEAAAGAGAEVLVAGAGVFASADPAGTIRTLRAKAQAAYSGRAG